jgi:hypothetical protein
MSEQKDEMVYLTSGPDSENGDFMLRSELPDDAFRAAFDIDSTGPNSDEPRMYAVYVVED